MNKEQRTRAKKLEIKELTRQMNKTGCSNRKKALFNAIIESKKELEKLNEGIKKTI